MLNRREFIKSATILSISVVVPVSLVEWPDKNTSGMTMDQLVEAHNDYAKERVRLMDGGRKLRMFWAE